MSEPSQEAIKEDVIFVNWRRVTVLNVGHIYFSGMDIETGEIISLVIIVINDLQKTFNMLQVTEITHTHFYEKKNVFKIWF